MLMPKLDTILKALKAMPAVVVAIPQFKTLFDQLIAGFDKEADQDTLKKAYDLAIADSNAANDELTALIKERTGQ